MARKPKQKEAEIPTETLSEALIPKVEETKPVETATEEPKSEIPVQELIGIPSIVQFHRVIEDFTDSVYMKININGEGVRKTRNRYLSEDIQDAYALGCRVDSLIEAKITSDRYILNGHLDKVKELEKIKRSDFRRFTDELEEYGYSLKTELTIKDLMVSVMTGSAIAVLVERVK